MTAGELARALDAELIGDADAAGERVSSITGAQTGSIVFAESAADATVALASTASIVIVAENATATGESTNRAVLVTKYPRLAFARAARLLEGESISESVIHPTAIVDDTATLGEGVLVGAHAVIAAGVVIGDQTRIYPRVIIYPKTTLGARCVVHAGVVLGADGFGYVRDATTGAYIQFPQQGTLVIGDDVEIGANSTIDRGALDATVIGNGVKIDNLVHVGHNVRIGNNVVIAAQTGISGSSEIGDNAVIAGQVGIADHVTIGDGVILGAQCGVPSNKQVRGPGQLFWGTPARPIGGYLKELATLARLARKPKKD